MKGIYYLTQYDDQKWGMNFRFIFRLNGTQSEITNLCDAVAMDYKHRKGQNNVDMSADYDAFLRASFSLKECKVIVPEYIDELALAPLDPIEKLLNGQKYYTKDNVLNINALELCNKFLVAVSSDKNVLSEFANNLAYCTTKIDIFIKKHLSSPYFKAHNNCLLSDNYNAHDSSPKKFFDDYYTD